jgi:hypothetical protein
VCSSSVTLAHIRDHIQTQHNRKNDPSMRDTLAHRQDHVQTQHNRKNDPSMRDTLAHIRDYMQKVWNYKTEAQPFHSKNSFKHLMMTILV